MEEKKSYLYLIFVLSFIIVISIAFAVFNSRGAASHPGFEKCNTVQYNGEDKINVLLFASEKEARAYTDFFLATSPYNEQRQNFNIYYIDSFKPECVLYKDIALFCDSADLRKSAASCPNDLIAVIKDDDSKIRSSSYRGVLSINSQHEKTVLTHEMGHAIARLAEEYENGQKPVSGSKNCKSSCEGFSEDYEGEIDGCFEGCSQAQLFRSIENGVMRTLSSNEYGNYNVFLINSNLGQRLDYTGSLLTGRQVEELNSCQDKEYLLVDVLNPNNVEYGRGCASIGIGGDKLTVTKEDAIVFSGYYDQPVLFTDAPEDNGLLEGETYFDSNLPFLITAPYGGDTLVIGDKEIDISQAGDEPCRR